MDISSTMTEATHWAIVLNRSVNLQMVGEFFNLFCLSIQRLDSNSDTVTHVNSCWSINENCCAIISTSYLSINLSIFFCFIDSNNLNGCLFSSSLAYLFFTINFVIKNIYNYGKRRSKVKLKLKKKFKEMKWQTNDFAKLSFSWSADTLLICSLINFI